MALQTAPDTTTRLNTEDLDGTIFISDNLPFLKSLDTESVDLVCIDPPFGKKQTFEGELKPPLSADERRIERELMDSWGVYDPATAYELGLEYPDQTGTTAKFEDIWNFNVRIYEDWLNDLRNTNPGAYWLIQSTRYTHSDGIAAYIAFMVERMIEIRRILKPTGSVYLHCDNTANAYLRQMMDSIFGSRNMRNEIVWARSAGFKRKSAKKFPQKSDTILFYAKSLKQINFNTQYKPHKPEYIKRFKIHDNGRLYRDDVNPTGGGRRIIYLDETEGEIIDSLWDDINPINPNAGERTGYPTQKPQTLARRIIEASSNPGDIVLDCFAGCAYVPVAAELSGRRWTACDMSPRAWTVVRRQFHKHPDLRIITEGELAAGEGITPRMENAGRIIRVRGPRELPIRATPDVPAIPRAKSLPEPQFKQRALETGDDIWAAFVEHWGTACWYCGTDKSADRRELQLDHIEPNKRDGTNDDCWNRALACSPCNGDKRDRLYFEETIDWALEQGRIATDARRDEVLAGFKTRHQWAKDRWERIKPNRIEM